jgi:hypothetical protein
LEYIIRVIGPFWGCRGEEGFTACDVAPTKSYRVCMYTHTYTVL